jgi:hypothetical protein
MKDYYKVDRIDTKDGISVVALVFWEDKEHLCTGTLSISRGSMLSKKDITYRKHIHTLGICELFAKKVLKKFLKDCSGVETKPWMLFHQLFRSARSSVKEKEKRYWEGWNAACNEQTGVFRKAMMKYKLDE